MLFRGVRLKCSSAIRCHHLIKTFYTGPGGWTDRQMPDGTVILTAPTGHIYTTEPHGASMFPALAQPTGELEIQPALDPPDTDRSAMMPRRKQTREQDRRDRINAERRERTETDRRRRTTTPSLARRQLRTATVLRRPIPGR